MKDTTTASNGRGPHGTVGGTAGAGGPGAAGAAGTVHFTVDGQLITARPGQTLLEALRAGGYEIPTLCHVEGLPPTGACRMCVVEVVGARGLVTSCSYPVQEGMVVHTHTPAVRESRRQALELILANHPQECLACVRSDDCELRRLAVRYGARTDAYPGARRHGQRDDGDVIVRDPDKCILCGRCVQVCQLVQGVGAIDFVHRGFDMQVAPAFETRLDATACVYCGQCVLACPTGALSERSAIDTVWEMLARGDVKVAVQFAPAVRVSVAEAFGAPPGAPLTGQLVAALRRLGFWKVYDTNFGADLTVMEEAAELVRRLKGAAAAASGGSGQGDGNGAGGHPEGPLPLMTSCCPAWVKFVEHYYPERLAHLSTCRSPHEMTGAVVKHFIARREGMTPQQVQVVSVMPCTAKKYEASRPELGRDGVTPVDQVLTTRELVRMLKSAGINPLELAPEPFDKAAGESTGAAAIFGSTGGVAEAALRTVFWMVTGNNLPRGAEEFKGLRDFDGVRHLEVRLGGRVVRCAVASSLAAARRLLDSPDFERLDFVEVMACPGGCVNGGGQMRPLRAGETGVALRRAQGLGSIDRKSTRRFAHDNPEVQTLYREWLQQPGSRRSHELLHTHYVERGVPVVVSG